MTHDSPKTLALFRTAGPCENCGTFSPRREPHHVVAKGIGAGKQMDLPLNLVAVGVVGSCQCHRDIQGRVPLGAMLVARREGLDARFVERQLWCLIRAPRECKPCPLCWGAGSIKVETRFGFRRHECVCRGIGIVDANGETWIEKPRRLAGT